MFFGTPNMDVRQGPTRVAPLALLSRFAASQRGQRALAGPYNIYGKSKLVSDHLPRTLREGLTLYIHIGDLR